VNTLAARRHDQRASAALRTGRLSTIVHVALIEDDLVGLQQDPPRPPVYRIEMIGAPPGVRRAGVVDPKASETSKAAEAPAGAEIKPAEKAMASKKAPTAATPKATPSTARSKAAGAKSASSSAKAALPKAGSGREGGKGADVRNMRTEGIEFPYPAYLTNIVRRLTLAYSPRPSAASLVAEIKFMIRRDGSAEGYEISKSSGNRLFDLEALGTVNRLARERRIRSTSRWLARY
jgi:protein TonB